MSRWPLRKAYFWQEAPLFRPLLPLIAGIVCYDSGLPAARYFIPVIVVLLCSGLLLFVTAVIRNRTRLLDSSHVLLLALFFAALGWCAYASNDSRNRSEWFAQHLDTGGACIVRIMDDPQVRASTTKATVEVLYSLRAGRINHVAGRALLYLYRAPGAAFMAKGDMLLVPARWQPVRNSGNPFEFDNANFQRRKGILFQQFLSPALAIRAGKANRQDEGFLDRTHNWCNRQLITYIRDSAALGLLQAMLLGDESAFDPELRQAYSKTGIIHIVSISGSHVAVLFLVVTGLLFWIRGKHGAWIKYAAGVALVWLYVLIAGAPPSALRSALMFTVIALSVVTDREGQSLNTLLGAAFVLLLAEPSWLFSVGFQLSFGAVLSILIFYKPVYQLWPQTSWLGKKTWQAVSVSIAAEILTAPLVIYYFHNFPLLFIVANLLSAVLVGFCALVGGMAIIALCWLPPIAYGIGHLVSQLVMFFNAIIIKLQHYNPPSFQYLKIDAVELLIIYILIAALGVCWIRREKHGILIALPAACALLFMLNADRYKALRQQRLIVYSNGGHPLAEQIDGQYFSVLVGKESENYNAKAAHIGWHAWKGSTSDEHTSCLLIKGKKALLLSDTTVNAYNSPFPVDVLIICRPLWRLQIASVLKAFSPRTIVLAQRPSAYHLQRWKDSCTVRGVQLHNVGEDGAFIME